MDLSPQLMRMWMSQYTTQTGFSELAAALKMAGTLSGFCECGQSLHGSGHHLCVRCQSERCVLASRGSLNFYAQGRWAAALPVEKASDDCHVCAGSCHLFWNDSSGISWTQECPGSRAKSNAETYTKAKLPGRYAGVTFGDIADRPRFITVQKVRDSVRATARIIQRGDPGFMLYGPNGVGKTMMAAALIRHLTVVRGLSARYLSWPDMVVKLRETYAKGEKSRDDLLTVFETVPFLVIDELGKGKRDWQVEELETLFSRRYDDSTLTTFAISNFTTEELRGIVGPRIPSLLSQMTTTLTIMAQDYRATARVNP